MSKASLGEHHLVDFYGCQSDLINDVALVRESMLQAAKLANATIVKDIFHEFNPHGISGVVVIAESHLAVHSWPEHSCVSLDLFTCSEKMNPKIAIDFLAEQFQAVEVAVQKIKRGQVANFNRSTSMSLTTLEPR